MHYPSSLRHCDERCLLWDVEYSTLEINRFYFCEDDLAIFDAGPLLFLTLFLSFLAFILCFFPFFFFFFLKSDNTGNAS
ncbi:hypothetical protein M441DRAFT_313234 [Trichoderma asperellum CBS 433.97]|uniref:Uncharacterized protein n=1 Tax=Trichoderma asperellum (strain ATCC 204424 / CBS 433.97 / NBRC 101777) TaxID=1042311 RepID=A0A2T3ZKH6_TRIA4|nr:hypothetical protein M441DRAFT_313234 [Trichoderma asperellum CBS 433.97]PTB45282.1 hypothetical protein M441DRAFT_313234 [Trichoderma asperellum CBS 433.97]